MPITTPVSFMASCFFVAMVLAAVVPIARAAAIVACDGVSSGAWESDFAPAGGSNINTWSFTSTTCYGNRITGLPRVKSFTYWVKRNSGSDVTAVGVVINADTNQVVASVNISTLLPTTNTYLAVTADFGSMVALDASKTYVMAFCATAGTSAYGMDSVYSGDSFRYCGDGDEYTSCTTEGVSWSDYNSATLRSNFAGNCSPSSASQLAAPQWAVALAHVVAPLTALWH